jgi:cell division protease FtsH
MILKWGMNDQLGLVVYNSRDQSYSNDTAALIDQEVKKLLDEAYAKAVAILKEKRSYAEAMAKKLIEKETLNAEEIREIIDGNPKKI